MKWRYIILGAIVLLLENYCPVTSLSNETDTVGCLNPPCLSMRHPTQTEVSEHYQDYPYPAYEEKEENGDKNAFLIQTDCHRGDCHSIARNNTWLNYYMYTIALGPLNHYLYKGKENFENNFRILLPGGGTGNSVNNLGEQLNHTNAEIVYLDFSRASMKVAQRRAKTKGLTNIRWFYDKIENIPKLNLGKFDLIECSGVLHHLPDPQEGLNILSQSLTDTGGMAIMVYARIGRTGIYQIQDLVRYVNEGVEKRKDELRNVWNILQSIELENLRRRTDFRLESGPATSQTRSYEDRQGGYWDNEAYDKFCHKQDRAYSAKELFGFIRAAGLNFVSVNGPRERFALSSENHEYFGGLDAKMKRHINRLSDEEKIAIAEIVDGGVDNHNVYASKHTTSEAVFEDPENVPFIYGAPKNVDVFVNAAHHKNTGKKMGKYNFKFRYAIGFPKGEWGLSWRVSEVEKRMAELMKSGNRTIDNIVDIIAHETKIPTEDIFNLCKEFYQDAKKADLILLKNKNINKFPKTDNLTIFALSA